MNLLNPAPLPRPYYKSPTDIKDGSEWDIVIIGGGNAGCVLAGRLSERSDLNVLLLEAGQSGSALLWTRAPALYGAGFGSEHIWNLQTVPQKHAAGKSSYWPRGKILGGCSAMNAMMFQSGAPEDFKEWSTSSAPGSSQWTYPALKPYFEKFERFSEDPNQVFMVNLAHRGREGKIDIGYQGLNGTWQSAWSKGVAAVGIEGVDDLNTPRGTLGYSQIMTYISPNGERSSAETGYLDEETLKRPNLTVVTGAHVTKLLFSAEGDKKRVTSIEFADRKNGDKRYTVKVKKEAVLSAGAVHSPVILMHSGVGPAAHLSQHKIPVVIDLPGVGQNLKDHTRIDVMYGLKRGSLSYLRPNSGWANWAKTQYSALQWLLFGAGDLQCIGVESAAFLRTDDPKFFPPSEYPRPLEDSTSGPGAPDIELMAAPISLKRGDDIVPNKSLGSFACALLRPTSVGEITLASNDPFADPIIDPHYCETQHDVDCLVRGMKMLLKIGKTAAVQEEIDTTETGIEFDLDLDKKTDAELEEVVRSRVQTMWHPVSTVRMTPLDEGGCVDYYLKLHGASNLRVVDDSVLPNIVSGHTAAIAFALGEKASDLIKEEWAVTAH